MKGDFSRDTFHEGSEFLRVLMQQGRVQIDADWNEQASIILHYLHALARDVIGPHGGTGFSAVVTKTDESTVEYSGGTITVLVNDFKSLSLGDSDSPEFYYVQGRRCAESTTLFSKEELSVPERPRQIVYLDVWERHISHIEHDYIREKALNGPDTSTRSKLMAQIEVVITDQLADSLKTDNGYTLFLTDLGIGSANPTRSSKGTGTGRMNAKLAQSSHSDSDPCIVSPDSRYRGQENQLYRVEIHESGLNEEATFKWSRDNGSVVLPIRNAPTALEKTNTITLEHLPRDHRLGLTVGDWVEVLDDDLAENLVVNNLFKVTSISEKDLQVVIEGKPSPDAKLDLEKHPLLRRWDPTPTKDVELTDGGVVTLSEGAEIELESGIVVQFVTPSDGEPSHYRTGDYWLIPARVATAGIEWDETEQGHLPQGINHYFAPLAHIAVAGENLTVTDLRRTI